jgi:hypothetical protein
MGNHKLEFIVAALLAAAGFLDFVLIYVILYPLSWSAVFEAISTDPGKWIFHVFLLPLATYAFIRGFPNDIRKRTSIMQRRVFFLLWGTAVVLVTVFASDAPKGFCERIPSIMDFGDKVLIVAHMEPKRCRHKGASGLSA